MKSLKKVFSGLLVAVMLLQIFSGLTLASAFSTGDMISDSFNGEGVWITEIYNNDVDRSVANNTRPANGDEAIELFDSTSDLMEFVEVVSTYDADIALNDLYELYYNSTLINITTVAGSSNVTLTKGQPVVIWNYRTDVTATLPTEAQVRSALRIPDNALVLKGDMGGGWDSGATFTLKLKATGETVCTFTTVNETNVQDGLAVELKVPMFKSADMEVYRNLNIPSAGYVYTDQVRGMITANTLEGFNGKGVYLTEVRPNDVNRSSTYGTASDVMECVEIYNGTDAAIDLNNDYRVTYTVKEGYRKVLKFYKYSSSASNKVGSSTGCTVPAGGTAVLWCFRYSNITDWTSFPSLSAFRTAYGISSDTPVYIFTNQGSFNNTNRAIEIFKNDGVGDVGTLVSGYTYLGASDCPDNTSAQLKVNPEGPAMKLYAGAATSTMGTVASDQLSYKLDTGVAVEMKVMDGYTIPTQIMQGEDLRVTFWYDFDSSLARTDTACYYRLDGAGDWIRTPYGGIRLPNTFEAVIPANLLFDHDYVEFYVINSNIYRDTLMGIYKVDIKGLNEVDGIRTNISENEEVKGTVSITANDGGTNASTKIYIDGTQYTTTPMMEDGAYFTFLTIGRDSYFKNIITTTGNKMIADIGNWLYVNNDHMAIHIDNSHFTYKSGKYTTTLRFWAGTYGTSVNEYLTPSANREDFQVTELMLKLPNGNQYLPSSIGPSSYGGVDTSAKTNLSTAFNAVHSIGDSSKMCPYMDVTFSVPSSAVNAVGVNLDTTKLSEGKHTLKVTNGTSTKEVTFIVDNTAPTVNMGIASGAELAGPITFNPAITDSNTMIEYVTLLDGEVIQRPYETTAYALGAGSHTLQVSAQDSAGNVTDKSVTFTVKDVSMTLTDVGSKDITHSTAQLYLTAQSGSAASATFYKAERIDAADIQATIGEGVMPYIQYTLNVGTVDADDEIIVSWDGTASASDDTHANNMYVLNSVTGGWDKIATSDGEISNVSFTAADHVSGGKAIIVVQCTAESNLPDLDPATDGISGANDGWDGNSIPQDYDFSFAWISDTQGYVQRYPWHYNNINQFIVDNAEAMKIKYVMHTGDIVDDWDAIYQWESAVEAMDILDAAGMPYGVLGGNHDVASGLGDNSYYWTYFGEDRVKDQPTFGGSYKNNLGHYDLISQNGQDFIIVYMSWNIYDEEIDWMNEVLAKYSDRKAILCFHAYTHIHESVDGLLDYYGVMVRDHVVAKNPNVFAVLNGHYSGSTYQTVRFDDNGDGKKDRTVYQICTDYQSLWHGGEEYIKFLYFDLDSDKIFVNSYSPYHDDFNYYDSGVHDLNALAKADSDGVVNALDVDSVIMDLEFDTAEQTIAEKSFTAYLATNEAYASADLDSSGNAAVNATGLTAGAELLWYADIENVETGYLRTPVYSFTTAEAPKAYYLFGNINGADYACEGDSGNMGIYKFEDGQLTATFKRDSYVGVKTEGNTAWYMAQSYVTDTTATLYNTNTGACEKLLVPGKVKVTFTLTAGENDTLVLSYTTAPCDHTYESTTVAPGCETQGFTTHTCTLCGDTYADNIRPSTGHSCSTHTVVQYPTCTDDGLREWHCDNCDYSYTESIAKLGHSYQTSVNSQPDCDTDGVLLYHCATCGGSYTEVIPALGHSYSSVVTAPTCTEPGYTTHTCATCGDIYTDTEIAALGHSYGSGVITKQPTCLDAGVLTYTCGTCGHNFSQGIPATGHNYVSGSCANCGEAEPVVDYYLFGYINGADYACEGDSENMGIYKFVDGKLTVTFTQDSYVAVKTTGNGCWYMTEGWAGDTVTSVTLYDNNTLFAPDKLFVPGNVQVTFTLVKNSDGSLTLSYTKAAPTITAKNISLSFEDEILLNVYFTTTDVVGAVNYGLLTFSEKVSTPSHANAISVNPGYYESNGYLGVTTPGIPAKKLGDTVYFAVYAELADGTYVYSKCYHYSPYSYAYSLLSKSTTTQDMKNLIVAMLNYGAAAQVYFNYNTANPVNASLTAEQKAFVADYNADMLDGLTTCAADKKGTLFGSGNTGFGKRTPSVNFEGAFSVNFYFSQPKATVGSDVTFYVWDKATYNSVDTLLPGNAIATSTCSFDGTYYMGVVEGIAAKEVDETFYCAAVYTGTDGNTYVSGVIAYSLGYYLENQANGTAMPDFAKATGVYAFYAKQNFYE